MAEVTVPGQRWTAESDGEIFDASVLTAMIAKHSDFGVS